MRFQKRYIILAIILLLAALIGNVVWRAVTAEPGPMVDYHQKMYELSAEAQGEGPDQWDVFEQVLAEFEHAEAALRDTDEAAGVENFQENPLPAVYAAGDGNPEDFAAMRERGRRWMASLAEGGLFDHTGALPAIQAAIRPPSQGPLLDVVLPHLGKSRRLARFQAARMTLAAERGDWGDYTAAFEESLATGRIVASQATPIDYMVGIAIESLALLELRRDLASGQIDDPAVIDGLLGAMERQRLPTVAHVLEGQRMLQLDIIQRIYTDDGAGDGTFILTEYAAMVDAPPTAFWGLSTEYRISNIAGFVFPSRAETVADMNRLFDPLVAEAALPAYQRTTSFDADQYDASLPARQFFLRLITTGIEKVYRNGDQARTIAAGTELLLRIERHRLQTGEAPASLADLAAAEPEADLIDPMTGEPFLYTRLADDPDGRPYLLYAAGADGRDDGGVELEMGALERAFHNDPGTDYVLNPPLPEPDWDEP